MSKSTIIKTHRKKSQIPGFLLKTYSIMENKDFKHIIDWTEDGKGFKIMDVDALEEQVLPCYFKHNKFSSFIRQLNMYDFHKIRAKGKGKEFRHRYFKKGKRDMLKFIKRKTPDHQAYEESSQRSIDGMINEFNDLQARYNELLEVQETSKFLEAEKALKRRVNSDIAEEFEEMIDLVIKVANNGKASLSVKEAAKFKLVKKLFKNLKLAEDGEKGGMEGQEEALGGKTNPKEALRVELEAQEENIARRSQCSTTDEERSSEEDNNDEEVPLLRKRVFEECCLSDPVVDYTTTAKKYSSYLMDEADTAEAGIDPFNYPIDSEFRIGDSMTNFYSFF